MSVEIAVVLMGFTHTADACKGSAMTFLSRAGRLSETPPSSRTALPQEQRRPRLSVTAASFTPVRVGTQPFAAINASRAPLELLASLLDGPLGRTGGLYWLSCERATLLGQLAGRSSITPAGGGGGSSLQKRWLAVAPLVARDGIIKYTR